MIENDKNSNEIAPIDGAKLKASNWEIIPVGERWMQQFRDFQSEAFRLEVLQAYAVPSEGEAFKSFLQGVLPSREFIADWCDLVSGHKESGHAMSRVHLVSLPLSDYMKFEIEGAYRYTLAAGEDIYLLDMSKVPDELQKLTKEDFCLFDDTKVMVQDYSEEGQPLHSRITTDAEVVAYYADIKKAVLALAEPVVDFYKREEGKSIREIDLDV